MPRYATAEEMFTCGGCELSCAIRELEPKKDSVIRTCPRCGLGTALHMMWDGKENIQPAEWFDRIWQST